MDQASSSPLAEGIALFNGGRFYDCHDLLEEMWLVADSEEQRFLQGLIQAAVAFHHQELRRRGAARKMLEMAIAKLSDFQPIHRGVRVSPFVESLREWKTFLDRCIAGQISGAEPPRQPRLILLQDRPGCGAEMPIL